MKSAGGVHSVTCYDDAGWGGGVKGVAVLVVNLGV